MQVDELLKQKGLYFTHSGHDYLIKCLNPDHDDNNPSCRVHKISGAVHCFSCGFKTNIYRYFGILTGNQVHVKIAKLKEKINRLKVSCEGLEYPDYYTPFTHSFRGISSETLKKFDAFYVTQEPQNMRGFENRIIFPIKDITGKMVMFLGRHMFSSGQPKYLNHPNGVQIPLYPIIMEKGTNSIVLVEGMMDMLSCYDIGIKNAVCTFGTNTLQKDTRNKLSPYRTQGISKVYIMFDGDDAGREAAEKLKPEIELLEFEVEIIQLEDDQDPNSMASNTLLSIKNYIYE